MDFNKFVEQMCYSEATVSFDTVNTYKMSIHIPMGVIADEIDELVKYIRDNSDDIELKIKIDGYIAY